MSLSGTIEKITSALQERVTHDRQASTFYVITVALLTCMFFYFLFYLLVKTHFVIDRHFSINGSRNVYGIFICYKYGQKYMHVLFFAFEEREI